MLDLFTKGSIVKKIYAPLTGKAVDIASVDDPVFSNKILGDGVAIEPAEGRIYAPFDGEMTVVPATKHVLGLRAKDGTCLVIHIGTDTMKLAGEGLFPKLKQGDRFKRGELIMEFDIDRLKSLGYSVITPVIVTSTDRIDELVKHLGDMEHGDTVAMEYKLK